MHLTKQFCLFLSKLWKVFHPLHPKSARLSQWPQSYIFLPTIYSVGGFVPIIFPEKLPTCLTLHSLPHLQDFNMSFLAAYTRPSSVSEIVKVSKAIQYVGHGTYYLSVPSLVCLCPVICRWICWHPMTNTEFVLTITIPIHHLVVEVNIVAAIPMYTRAGKTIYIYIFLICTKLYQKWCGLS